MSDSITESFIKLKIPLVNKMWSWGARNDRVVVLRV